MRSVPGATAKSPRLDATSVGSSEDADVAGAESEAGEVDSGLKRKRATSDDGAGTSKRVPIFACPRDILNPFALEKEIPLKVSLEAHAIRLAKKKGVKGKAILCGVGAAHIPRSDGVPVSVATVSPKDSKLEEAGDAAYQVGSSERSRCHSI
ncbi:hypothetical protein Tco_0108333 [Tanacetum coccineum]